MEIRAILDLEPLTARVDCDMGQGFNAIAAFNALAVAQSYARDCNRQWLKATNGPRYRVMFYCKELGVTGWKEREF